MMNMIMCDLRRRRRREHCIGFAAALFAAGSAAVPAGAGDIHWNSANSSWNNATAWNPAAVPGSGDNAVMDFRPNATTAGVARVITDVGRVSQVIVMRDNRVDVITRGVLKTFADVIVGLGPSDGAGGLTVSSNTPTIFNPAMLEVGRVMRLGVQDAFGRVDHSADFVSVNGDLALGYSNLAANPAIPRGVYNQTGGRLTVGQTVYLGLDNTGSQGEFSISSPAFAQFNRITSNSAGVFNHFGGEVHVGQGGLVFPAAPASMRYTLGGGSLLCARTTVNDGGELIYEGGFFSAGQLDVNGGRVVLRGPGEKIIRTIGVTVTDTPGSTGFIDLNDGGMAVDSVGQSTNESIRSLIASGYRDGQWTSGGIARGITSTAAGLESASAHPTALGYRDTNDFGPGIAGGSTVIVKYTFYGDANLDEVVNLDDFNRFAAHFGGTNKFWTHGDFNYDGVVNLNDFNLLARNFGVSLAAGAPVVPQDWAALAAAVPEPACALCFGGVATLAAMVRSRRKRS